MLPTHRQAKIDAGIGTPQKRRYTELEIQQTKNALDKYQKELREYNRKGGE